MRSFAVTLSDDQSGEPKRIEFEASEPHEVFDILSREDKVEHAVLWEGEKRLAKLRRTTVGGWQIWR